MPSLSAISAMLSGSSSSSSSSPTSPTGSLSRSSTASSSKSFTPSHSRSSSTSSVSSTSSTASRLSFAGLMADTMRHEVKLIRYTEQIAQYQSSTDEEEFGVDDDSKSEKKIQKFFERDWDQQDWDADAEVWEEPDWSQRVREEKWMISSRKEARI